MAEKASIPSVRPGHPESAPAEEAATTVVARFFLLFGHLEDETLAQTLGCTARTVRRYRAGDTNPDHEVRDIMRRETARVQDLARMGNADFIMMAEKRRAEHEKRQRETRLATYVLDEEKEIPKWFARVHQYMDDERYSDAYDYLVDHIEDETAWRAVDEVTRTYVLVDMSQACHKTGRFVEAERYSRQALEARRSYHRTHLGNQRGDILALYEALCLTNTANAIMKLGRFSEASELYVDAMMAQPGYAPAYYSALCCAALSRNTRLVYSFAGRLQQVALTSLSADDIQTVLQDMDKDSDLDSIRSEPIYKETVEGLTEALTHRLNREDEAAERREERP